MEEDVRSVTLMEGAPLKMLLMCTLQCTFIKTALFTVWSK